MADTTTGCALDFIAGGGEMGGLIRAHDWSATPLGPPETWPTPLRTVLRILLNTGHPMYVFWGADGLCFYNDAYRRSLGPERHPGSLGLPARAVWDEIWETIGPQIDRVMAGRGATWHENHLVPITRHGRREDVYWTYSYGPIDDPAAPNGVGGVLVVCSETTQAVVNQQRLEQERQRQRRLLEQAPGFVLILDGPDHIVELVNDAHKQLFGDRDSTGKPIRDTFPDMEGQGFFKLLDRIYTTGETHKANATPVRWTRPETGEVETRYLDFVFAPTFDADGKVSGIFSDGLDVTDRIRADEERAESEARFRTLAEAIGEVFYLTDLRARKLMYVSPAFDEIWGRPRSDLFERPRAYAEAIHPDDQARAYEAYLKQEAGIATEVEYRVVRPNGEERWILDRSYPVRDDQGEPMWAAGIAEDITERRRVEQQAHDSMARLAAIADALPVLISHVGTDERYLFVNRAYEAWFGMAREDIVGRTLGEVLGTAARAAIEPELRNVLAGQTLTFEREMPYEHGGARQIHVDYIPERDPDGIVSGFYALVQDVSAERQAEAALRASEERYRSLFERLDAGFCVIEMRFGTDGTAEDYRFVEVNRAFEGQTGLSDAAGKWVSDLVPAHNRSSIDRYGQVARTGEALRFENMSEGLDDRWYDVHAFPIDDRSLARVAILFNDITDRKRVEEATRNLNETLEERIRQRQAELDTAQEALRQSQKLEAMGQLTGGVAHDFNNLLTPIIGSLDLLQRRGVGGEREGRLIEGALQSAERAKLLVQRLLAFARRQPLQPRAVDIAELIAGMADLVASTIGPKIRVVRNVDASLPFAHADINQIEMALLNLSVNARDAMPDGGTLTISANSVEVGAGQADLSPGLYVRLSVSDTGLGMDQATLNRAVEPFFSTKGLGQGTGLGLSMVHGLALQLGGRFALSSAPQLGTTAELWLRAAPDQDVTRGVRSAEVVPERGAGSALLVDDEDLVRATTADMLVDIGYQVTQASSGAEALRHLRSGAGFDVLITDHLMPGMAGTDLARAARNERPGMPVLIISGYADVEEIAPDLPRLAKPFRQAELAAAIGGLGLDRSAQFGAARIED